MTVIAIDGPAGSGKSTVAAALAERLGLRHVDTGAHYRAATLAVLRAGVDPDDAEACLDVVRAARIERQGGRTYLDGQDVEAEIRGAAVTAAVSQVSAHPDVRRELLEAQRREAAGGCVVEGRDAGTVVVPDADLKVWLVATVRERAARRAAQLGERGDVAVSAHEAALQQRDAADAAQMEVASDAMALDTTGRSVTEIVDEVLQLLATRPANDR